MTIIERPRALARITGGAFLSYFALTIFADALARIGFGSPEDVCRVAAEEPGKFALAVVLSLASSFLFLATAWGLYALLRRAQGDLALAFLVLNAVGTAVHCASLLPLIAVPLLGGSEALVAVAVYKKGFVFAQLFFGTWLFPLGYLARKSGLLPRLIGVLLTLDGVGVLVWFFQALLFPSARAIIAPGLVVSFVAEFSLALWLLVRGVRTSD